MKVRTGTFDGGTNKWKFAHNIELVGDQTTASIEATVSWADGNSVSFNAGRTIDTSKKEKASGLGRFLRRNHQVTIDAAEQYRIEALELDYTEGGH
jgi:hypothetical protein